MSSNTTQNQTSQSKVLVEFKSPVLVCRLTPRFQVYNDRATSLLVYIVTGVSESEFNGRRYLWISVREKSLNFNADEVSFDAPQGSFVILHYSSGSRKHVYSRVLALFRVKPKPRHAVGLEDQLERRKYTIEVENLELLPIKLLYKPTGFDDLGYIPENEAEIRAAYQNAGYTISRRKPSNNLLAYLVYKIVQEEEQEKEEVEAQTEAMEEQQAQPQPQIELPELELELELEAAPQPQTVQQVQQAQPTQVSTAVETPRKPELVKIYLLKMRLPSKYLVQKIKIEENGQGIREIRDFSDSAIRAAVASRLEGIRRKAYELIERHFVYVDSYGMWIAVSEEAVERAKEVNKWIEEQLASMPALRQLRDTLPRYFVRATKVYLEPEEARELLYEARKLIEEELAELKQRIAEAEKEGKKRALRLLEQKLEYKQALLEAFKQYLESLGI